MENYHQHHISIPPHERMESCSVPGPHPHPCTLMQVDYVTGVYLFGFIYLFLHSKILNFREEFTGAGHEEFTGAGAHLKS